MFEIAERGYIREGYWADLTVVDPNAHTVVDEEPVHAKCGWTPFRGFTFRSRITHTFVNGNLAFADGRLQDATSGVALEYAR